MKKYVLISMAALAVLATSCKKDPAPDPDPDPTDTTATVSLADRQKDTAVLYSRDIYLWYNQIPATFNGRNYNNLNAIMEAMRAYSKEPGFSDPVDRWSFAIDTEEWDDISSGVATDKGMYVFFKAEGDLRVRYVEKNSPAWNAGVRRGWQLLKINTSSDIKTNNANYIIQSVYYDASTTFVFKKNDGTISDEISLTGAEYQSSPFLKDSTYAIGGKKIGYMVYNSFLGEEDHTLNNFERIINRFQTAGVNDVIIDLRYNGGGYVSFQDALANYLAPTAANNQLMRSEKFNAKYAEENTEKKFAKKGTLNLSRIFFIVSSNTASASELLINNLKPYMDVYLVGPSASYGKPVGYFGIPIGKQLIFPVSFRNTNADGEGNYFDGLELDNKVADGIDKDWGNLEETALASAVKFITSGAFRLGSNTTKDNYVPDPIVDKANEKLVGPVFNGAVGRILSSADELKLHE